MNQENLYFNESRNWQPATSNLFAVHFPLEKESGNKENHYSWMHCSKVTINGDSIDFQRHPITKRFTLTGYKEVDEVSITWREHADFRVARFHYDWLSLFYDRKKGLFKSNNNPSSSDAGGRLKDISIHIRDRDPQLGFTLCLYKAIPNMNPSFDFDWSNGNGIEYTLTYKVESWELK